MNNYYFRCRVQNGAVVIFESDDFGLKTAISYFEKTFVRKEHFNGRIGGLSILPLIVMNLFLQKVPCRFLFKKSSLKKKKSLPKK